MESLWKYYGIDWAGITFSMVATYYLGKKRKRGFLIGMVGNIAFVAFGVLAQSAANIVANGIYFFLNARGWWNWKAEPPVAQAKDEERALAREAAFPKPQPKSV
jgi:nicotinamide riboside transporter PnuC